MPNRQAKSAIVITHNVAATIGACVEALRKVCDEVLVLDSSSTDGTAEICERLGATVVQQEWLGFARTKNVGNQMARHDWILSIDSDEVLSDQLIATLNSLQAQPGCAYALDRLTNYCGHWVRHSGWYPEWKVRLFDRREAAWQGDYVHETLRLPTGCRVVKLTGKLLHYSYTDAADHQRRIERYARLAAGALFAKQKKANWLLRWAKPPLKFFTTYVLRLGFLDGKAGWAIALGNARSVWLRYRFLDELWAGKTQSP